MTESLKLNKKVLIITGYAPPKVAGGPDQLYNLFTNIDKDDYCIFTKRQNFTNKKSGMGKKLEGTYHFFNDTRRNGLFNFFSTIGHGLQIIKKERIDLLMGVTDNGKTFLTTYILAKLSRKPYSIYLMDIYKGNNFPLFWDLLSRFFEKFLLNRAQLILTSSPDMKLFYQERYPNLAKKFESIHICTFPENYSIQKEKNSLNPPFHIVYTGHIYWAQESSIIDLIEAINEMADINIELDIYSLAPTEKILALSKQSNKIKVSSANQAEIPRIQGGADILFLPYSWDTPGDFVIRTGLPSKMTGFLLSGSPIIVYAPAYSYLSRYAKENNFALVVDVKNKEKLKIAIRKLISDKDYSNVLIEKAQKTFWANHDARKNSALLALCINTLVTR